MAVRPDAGRRRGVRRIIGLDADATTNRNSRSFQRDRCRGW
jgi:hypothetical protein